MSDVLNSKRIDFLHTIGCNERHNVHGVMKRTNGISFSKSAVNKELVEINSTFTFAFVE